jgi:hypothetical protein
VIPNAFIPDPFIPNAFIPFPPSGNKKCRGTVLVMLTIENQARSYPGFYQLETFLANNNLILQISGNKFDLCFSVGTSVIRSVTHISARTTSTLTFYTIINE